MRTLILALAATFICAAAQAGDPAKAQVMVVATYHFGNPGADLHNIKAIDVLAADRQKQIAAAVSALAKFQPDQVGVEWPDSVAQERYPKFLDGSLPVSSNEVIQLGFRLARERGLKVVHGLDVEGDFPFDAVTEWAAAHGRQSEIDAWMAAGEKEVQRISDLQQRTTIGGVLRDMNGEASIGRNHAFYPAMLGMGSGDDQPGVKLLSAWYTRNLAICARLVEQLKPGDRAVVFYGQGHVYLLKQCLREQPNVQLVDPLKYLAGT